VTDDEIGHGAIEPRHRVPRRGRQRQKRALGASARVDPHHPIRLRHQPRRSPAKEAMRALETIGPRHEDMIARAKSGGRVGLDHLARRLVARHQRIAHARKGRHLPRPEEFLGSRGNARMSNLDHQIPRARPLEREPVHAKILRTFQKDSAGIHGAPSSAPGRDRMARRNGRFPDVILRGQGNVSSFVYTRTVRTP
jgi:hypothetical protein